MRTFRVTSGALGLLVAIAAPSLGACSPSVGDAGSGAGAGASGNATGVGGGQQGGFGGALGGSTGIGGAIDLGGTTAVGGAAGDGGPTCSTDVHEGERLPLDMYFLVDTSGSMGQSVQGGTKWSVVSGSLVAFLNDPSNADIATGIGYFPTVNPNAPKTCTTDADCTVAAGNFGPCVGAIPFLGCVLGCACAAGDNCQVSSYSTPSVPLSLPPNHAPVVSDIALHGPAGGTPTAPALTGAMQVATQWAQANPGRTTVVVLATDGDPTGCAANTVQDIANVAAQGLSSASHIKTFVIGVGKSLTSLNAIAAAGGTGQAFVLDTGGNVAQQFSDALAQIRGQAVPCDFKVPTETSSGKVDPGNVNVRYTAKTGQTVSILQTFDGKVTTCDPATGGWYYDDPSAPTLLKMCPASCATLTQGGRVAVELGCATQKAPPPR